jgi:hypothetical protein
MAPSSDALAQPDKAPAEPQKAGRERQEQCISHPIHLAARKVMMSELGCGKNTAASHQETVKEPNPEA